MRAFDPPLIRSHSYLALKERLLLVATFQDCPEFENLPRNKRGIGISASAYFDLGVEPKWHFGA